jgi:hypothetical protein
MTTREELHAIRAKIDNDTVEPAELEILYVHVNALRREIEGARELAEDLRLPITSDLLGHAHLTALLEPSVSPAAIEIAKKLLEGWKKQ